MALTIFDPYGSIEIPEGSTGLDAERRRDEFYQLIGKCIKEWANVEQKLFELCVFALNAPRTQAAVVYYKTPTIDARLTLTDELVRVILPKKERPDGGKDHKWVVTWAKLYTDIKDLLPERNLLAHAPVREVETVQTLLSLTGEMRISTLASWLEIVMSEGEKLRGKADKPPIRAQHLKSHLEAVKLLAARISVFHGTIAAEPPATPSQNSTAPRQD